MLAEFYGDTLPNEGSYALWTKTDKQHHWSGSLDELTENTQDAIDNEVQGLYFATAAFNEQAAINGNKDSRTQANVLAKKCFYLDLDAGAAKFAKHGPDKVYETQRDAKVDAIRFCKETGLAPSYFVSSGEGLHLYWCLETPVSESEWSAAARKLSRLFKQCGLKEDSAVTADSARILRPIGTLHENGKEVTALQASRKLYDFDSFVQTVVSLLDEDTEDAFMDLPKKRKISAVNSDVLVEGPPKTLKRIIPKCGALADAMKAKGNVEEPYWRAMLGIIKHTVEGDAAAHKFSSGHPEYDARDTQRKLDNWKTGPTTCAEFSKYSSKCSSCPQRGVIKSPIVVGAMTNDEVHELPPEKQPAAVRAPTPTGNPWDGQIPEGFDVRNGMMVYNMPIETENEDGDTVTVYRRVPFTSTIFWLSDWSDSDSAEDNGMFVLSRWNAQTSTVRSFTYSAGLSANQQKFREEIAMKHIHTASTKGSNQAMEAYCKAQLERLLATPSREKITSRLGVFIAKDGSINAAQGEHVIKADGTIRKAIIPVGSTIQGKAQDFFIPLPEANSGEWGASVWEDTLIPKAREYVEFVKRYYAREGMEKFQFAIMAGLASPLMPFVRGDYRFGMKLPGIGITTSLYSTGTGRGKSAAMRTAVLAFGNPTSLARDQNDTTSTALGRIETLSQHGTLPVVMDEMGETKSAAVASLVSAIANGSSRVRAGQSGGTTQAQNFALSALIATNVSARDMIVAARSESKAIQARLLELNVEDVEKYSAEENEAFASDWSAVQSTAGALGAVIHLYICQLGVDRVNKLVMDSVAEARKSTSNDTNDARFQYALLGVIKVLQKILKPLDLRMFEWEVLQSTFQAAHDNGVEFVEENTMPTDGLALLNIALNGLMPNTAVTATETHRRGSITKFDDPLVQVPLKVNARHVVDLGRTYVSSTAIREWCAENKVPLSKLMSDAKIAGVAIGTYASTAPGAAKAVNLLRGMRGSTGVSVPCYAFDTNLLASKTGLTLQLAEPDTRNVVPLHRPESARGEAAPGDAAAIG